MTCYGLLSISVALDCISQEIVLFSEAVPELILFVFALSSTRHACLPIANVK